MGLGIVIGGLADLTDDPEGAEWRRSEFEAVNVLLRAHGLPEHQEPETLPAQAPWSCDMWGYSGLHYLRRIAAHVWAGRDLPPPGDDDAASDPLLNRYGDSFGRSTASGLGRLLRFGKPRGLRFDHLIQHSDAEGFYLPLDFKDVLYDTDDVGVPGATVGSSPRLMKECEHLAEVLELPLDLDPDSDAVYEAAQSQGEGPEPWQRYGVESFTCLSLWNACKRSIEWGAAIVFC